MALVTATFCKLLSVRYEQSFFIHGNGVIVNVDDITCHRVPSLFLGDFFISLLFKNPKTNSKSMNPEFKKQNTKNNQVVSDDKCNKEEYF